MPPARSASARVRGAIAVVVLAASLAACGTAPRSAAPTAQQVATAFAGSPPPLAALHADGGKLLPEGQFKARLAGLRGYPAVVNIWGSWCDPCRAEFPILQQAAVALGRRVAFVGLDVSDNPGAARAFLGRFPVTYPSFEDPGAHTAFSVHAGSFYPTTEFYDRSGRLAYTHAGPYLRLGQLLADARTYGGA